MELTTRTPPLKMPHNTPDIFDLPSFPAPDLRGVLESVKEVFQDLQGEVTGPITNISQAVLDIWEMDCGGKWVVYLNTGTVALGKALWLLLTPDIDEIFENYLQPKPGRRHGRRGQRGDRARRAIGRYGYRLFFRPPIPDIDEVIASLIPGSNALKGRRMGPGEWIFWTAVDVADAILWHWLLLVATETFTVEWQSELMQSGECKSQNDGSCQFTTPFRTADFGKEMWLDRGGLIGLFEENMNVGNNAVVSLEQASFIGDVLMVVESTWQCTAGSADTQYGAEVGMQIKVDGVFPSQSQTFNETTSVVLGKDGTTTAFVQFVMVVHEYHRASFAYSKKGIPGMNGLSTVVNTRISMAARGVKSV